MKKIKLTRRRIINIIGFIGFVLTILISNEVFQEPQHLKIIAIIIAIIGYFTNDTTFKK